MRTQLGYLRRDLARYTLRERLSEPVIVALVVYRLGRGALELPAPLRQVASVLYMVARTFARVVTSGVDIPRRAQIGPGLRLFHSGPIVLSHRTVIGSDCVIGHGATIGSVDEVGGHPVIGDGVVLSAYTVVIGGISIGDGAKIGAMSVVLRDVPAYATAAGAPARVLNRRSNDAGPGRRSLPASSSETLEMIDRS